MPIKSTERTLRRCMRKLLRNKKLDQITVVDICDASEIAKRTFYRYYPDKYALLEDVYVKEYFDRLEITEELSLYEIYERMADQMYQDQEFFQHIIEVKGQNGFWELITNLLFPFFLSKVVNDPSVDKERDYYTKRDIDLLLHFFEAWIAGGFAMTPKEFVEYIRLCNAVHGKWEYQLATGREPDPYHPDKFHNNEW